MESRRSADTAWRSKFGEGWVTIGAVLRSPFLLHSHLMDNEEV